MKPLIALVLTLTTLAVACQGNVFDLEVGQCFNDPENFAQVADVEIVDCTEPHDNEVFAVFDMSNDEYPGADATSEIAQQGCLERFQGYVGSDYESSQYVLAPLTPSEESWEDDDREVVCFLFDIQGVRLTASVEGNGR